MISALSSLGGAAVLALLCFTTAEAARWDCHIVGNGAATGSTKAEATDAVLTQCNLSNVNLCSNEVDCKEYQSDAKVPAIPLAGQWYHDGLPGPYVTADSGGGLVVNMAYYKRPLAYGKVLSSSRIEVTFGDVETDTKKKDATFTGSLMSNPDRILWSNDTVWVRTPPSSPPPIPQPIFDLSGRYSVKGKMGPEIRVEGRYLMVDMSAYGRPQANGYILNPSTIGVTFSDAGNKSITGRLKGGNGIEWSNDTAWSKAVDLDGLQPAAHSGDGLRRRDPRSGQRHD